MIGIGIKRLTSGFFFALVFLRLEKGHCQNSLVLSQMIANWLLKSSTLFELTFSTLDTYQVQILTKCMIKQGSVGG